MQDEDEIDVKDLKGEKEVNDDKYKLNDGLLLLLVYNLVHFFSVL